MPQLSPGADFPEHADENRRLWDANAAWWDDKIGDGNDIQDLLIAPASERLLAVHPDDTVLDMACGAGRFTRRLAELGARVTAFDHSEAFIEAGAGFPGRFRRGRAGGAVLPGGGEFATGIAVDRHAGDSAGAGREDEPARVRSDPPVNGSRVRQ
jgi:SAM-dependent methyltransferase